MRPGFMKLVAIMAILLFTGVATVSPSFGKTPNPEASVYGSDGKFVGNSRTGLPLTISKIFLNTEHGLQEFTVIFEVRKNDVTEYSNLSGGILPPAKATHVGVSWEPASPGEYQIRVFVVSNMTKPVLLENVATSRFIVS